MKKPAPTRPGRRPLAPSIPDFCPGCDAVDAPFLPVQREIEQDFRGETYRVTSPAFRCRHCGFQIAAPGHLAALRLATHEAYRREHKLLTGKEIAARRKAMGLSQKRFAAYLGVGSASIERWESGVLVQDKASDLLLRERTEHTLFLSLPAGCRSKRLTLTIPAPVTALPSRSSAKPTKTATFRVPDTRDAHTSYPASFHALTTAA